MEQKTGIAFNTEEINRITMIVTDEDKDEALVFVKEIEKKLRLENEGKLQPRFKGGTV